MILSMSTTVRRAREITVELPPEQAMALFTPEGERRWAHGWDPHYPEPRRREGPGAVFTTGHGGHQTTWIMVDHEPGSVRYARVTESMTAGTVAVDLVGSREQSTQVRVTYDLTSLSPAGETWLDSFDAHYEAAIGEWATEIAAALH
jgi:CubicO group peptidase (beta-lactamase class C family)